MLFVSHLVNREKSYFKQISFFFYTLLFSVVSKGRRVVHFSSKSFLKPHGTAAVIANIFSVYSTFHFGRSLKCFTALNTGIISHTTESLYQKSSCTSCREAGGLPRNIPEEGGGHHSTVPPSGLVRGKRQQWYCPSLPRIYATRPSTARGTASVWASRRGKRMGFSKRGWCAVEGPVSPEASWAQVSLSGKNWPARTGSGAMSTYSLFLFFFYSPSPVTGVWFWHILIKLLFRWFGSTLGKALAVWCYLLIKESFVLHTAVFCLCCIFRWGK